MPADLRQYLMDRFHTDAITLRARADALTGSAQPIAGPNAEVSRQMANACDDVVKLAASLPELAPAPVMLAAFKHLLPELANLAGSPLAMRTAAVRSVYVGAATRIQELMAIESGANSLTADNDDDDLDDDE